MNQIITATGLEYNYQWPSQRPVCIEDIAHQLALINRFHGATRRPYSVAEHSLLVCQLARQAGASPMVQLAALMHDAHEAYTQDLASPAKRAVDQRAMRISNRESSWQAFEHEHAHHLRQHFGLLTVFAAHHANIRHWDLVALATERRDLTAYVPGHHAPWPCLRDGQADAIQPDAENLNTVLLRLRSWEYWHDGFMDAFCDLRGQAAEAASALLAQPVPGAEGA